MITKLIFKILFKATLPLVAMVGITSYVLYTKGGDPLQLLKIAGGGISEKASGMLGSARQNSADALSSLQQGGENTDGDASGPIMYRWKDASGATHFGNVPPSDAIELTQLNIDPDRNMIPARKKAQQAVDASAEQLQTLPGAAGIALPGLDAAAILGRGKQ